jgi:hypothetical protein
MALSDRHFPRTSSYRRNAGSVLAAVVLLATPLPAQTGAPAGGALEVPPRRTFPVTRATGAIEVDGVLDDEAWTHATAIELSYEFFPGDNVTPPVRTECRITFDDSNVYLGCTAFDPHPGEIRAHLADRDAITTFQQDDHIAVQFDPFNDERRAFQFRVNPLGVQADAIFSELDGIEDWAWDAIWQSAGRITGEGYVVEVAVPFNQLRFPRARGAETWGLDLYRSYPRNVRHRISAAYRDRNRSCLLCQIHKIEGFAGITPGRNLEIDPTATAHRTDRRDELPGGPFHEADKGGEAGVTAKWGITPNLILNGTVNPDFSQVEADVAQLEVNTRFALFYEEKRPFFLEGTDFFATPLPTVHTRTVADPRGGLKVTGKAGRDALGVFVARDAVNNLVLPANQGSDYVSLDQRVWSGVVRYRRDLGKASTVGAVYTGREGDGYHNHLYGVDTFVRLSSADTVRAQYTRSDTRYPDPVVEERGQKAGAFGGGGFFADYNHQSQNWMWFAQVQDLGRNYRADSGFIPRVDVRTAQGAFARVLHAEAGHWYSQLNLQVIGLRTEDHDRRLTDQKAGAEVVYAGPLQSVLDVTVSANKERLAGVLYDLDRVELTGEIRPTGNLRINVAGAFGDSLDVDNHRKGSGLRITPSIEYRLGRSLELRLSHDLETLDVDAGRVFTARLTQGRLVYYLGTRVFARLILQYLDLHQDPALYVEPVEPRTRRLFSQFLFSYKLNPQTVFFLGYSDNSRNVPSSAELARTDRTFFVKLGYAWVL